MIRKTLLLPLALTLLLPACQAYQMGPKQSVGTLGGAAAGGLIGSSIGSGPGRLAATGAGVLIGAWLGNEIGASLDNADRAAAQQAADTAWSAPVGQEIRWDNPESRHRGVIVPLREGYRDDGRYCREFEQTIIIYDGPHPVQHKIERQIICDPDFRPPHPHHPEPPPPGF